MRAYLGGARRPEMVERSDAELLGAVRDELRALLGITAEPVLSHVGRQRRAFAVAQRLDAMAVVQFG